MQIKENIHLIRKDFYVTPEVKRFVNPDALRLPCFALFIRCNIKTNGE